MDAIQYNQNRNQVTLAFEFGLSLNLLLSFLDGYSQHSNEEWAPLNDQLNENKPQWVYGPDYYNYD